VGLFKVFTVIVSDCIFACLAIFLFRFLAFGTLTRHWSAAVLEVWAPDAPIPLDPLVEIAGSFDSKGLDIPQNLGNGYKSHEHN